MPSARPTGLAPVCSNGVVPSADPSSTLSQRHSGRSGTQLPASPSGRPTQGFAAGSQAVWGDRRGVARSRGRHPFGIIACDADPLKGLNDSRGHAAGDALLVAVARAAETVIRDCDVISRPGGDEFVVCLGDARETDARLVGERLLDKLHRQFVRGTAAVSVGIAGGSAGADRSEASRLLDAAMYQAKSAGGDRWALEDGPGSARPGRIKAFGAATAAIPQRQR